MALHLIKLCVGCDSVADLEAWIAERARQHGAAARQHRAATSYDHVHVTRMMPKRVDDLLPDGSLFWVIRGQLSCRQSLRAIRGVTDAGGIGRCHLVLDPRVVTVSPRPVRPFQGWRYLDADAAPPDLGGNADTVAAMPDSMRRELATLGLL